MIQEEDTFTDNIKDYKASEIVDGDKHDSEVEHMFYIWQLNHLLVMERDSKKFKVYDADNGKLIQTVPEKSSIARGAVISADYIEDQKLVATTANNNSINLWD